MNRIAQQIEEKNHTHASPLCSVLPSVAQPIEQHDASFEETQQALSDLIYEGLAERNPGTPSAIRMRTPSVWGKISGNNTVTEAAKHYPQHVIAGNADPQIIASGTPTEILNASRIAIETGKQCPGGYVFYGGSELTPITPPYHIYLMQKAIQLYGEY